MADTLYVQPVLERFPPDFEPTHVEPLGAAGGMSGALFWRVTCPRGTFALRRWPAEHPTSERLRFIHSVVRHAHQRGCSFLAVPVNDVEGETFVAYAGHLWELAPWMPGEADYERSPSPAKLAAALAALARFHAATAGYPIPRSSQFAGAPNAVVKRLARLRELETGGIATLERTFDTSVWPDLAPLARAFLAALPRAVPGAIALLQTLAGVALPMLPCLRDIWHDHLLFTGDEVTGVIDFGAVDVDTPAVDVARLLGSLVGDNQEGWRTGMAAYSAIRPLSDAETRAVTALDVAGTVLAGCNWIRWIYSERREFENRAQVLARFTRLLERVNALATLITPT